MSSNSHNRSILLQKSQSLRKRKKKKTSMRRCGNAGGAQKFTKWMSRAGDAKRNYKITHTMTSKMCLSKSKYTSQKQSKLKKKGV